MGSVLARRAASARVLTAKQYAELRSELKAELRRLLPAADQANEPDLRHLAPRARTRALQLVDVLRRMDTKTFGVCAGCESPIAYERLSAIPETRVCAPCSRSREVSLQGGD
jgi:RNA polymerase-binding transcription factor DksA